MRNNAFRIKVYLALTSFQLQAYQQCEIIDPRSRVVLLCVLKVSGSNFGLEIGYPLGDICDFSRGRDGTAIDTVIPRYTKNLFPCRI
jgi:hypothetical protein